MITCIIDYIGISYCEGQHEGPYEPVAYLNTLPGISVESLDKIATSEQITYLGLWADIQKSAARQFKTDVILQMRQCHQLNDDCNYETLICDNLEVLLDAWMYLCAIWAMTFRLTSDRLTRYTTVDREQANDLRTFYEEKYRTVLEQSVQLLDISGCELCCGGSVQTVTYLP